MKHLALALFIVLAVGCSSESKKDHESTPKPSKAPAPSVDSYTPPPVETTQLALQQLPAKYSPLKAAVTAQRSSAIQEEASKILSSNPNDPIALNALAMMHMRAGRLVAARLLLSKAVEKNPPSSALFNNMAVLNFKEDDPQAAYLAIKKATKTEMQHGPSIGNLAILQMQSGDIAKAQAILPMGYDSNPQDLRLNQLQAISYRINTKYSDSRVVYERLMKMDARNGLTMINYATLLIDYMNQPKDGMTLLNKIKFISTERRDIIKRVEILEQKVRAQGL